jgi:hypothetical protein
MTSLNEKERRDFVSHTVLTIEENAAVLTAAGFDPANRVTTMKTKMATAEQAEVKQQQAQAAALDATKVAIQTLREAYDDASEMVSLIEGLLGKDNSLVHKLRQFRN